MRTNLPQGLDLERPSAGLEQVPVLEKLVAVNLHPGFDQSKRASREFASKHFCRIDCDCGGVFLIPDVNMWPVMAGPRFSKHPDDDSEETGDLGHGTASDVKAGE